VIRSCSHENSGSFIFFIMKSKAQRNIQKYSEKVFKRLIIQFLQYLDENPKATSESIGEKKTILNNKWVEHCLNNPFITSVGLEIFLQEIDRLMQDKEMIDIMTARKEGA